MRYQTADAFRMALERRLLARSQETGLGLSRLRKLVASDRLLARLLVAAPGRWVLKGGLALDFRLRERARATLDVDLARQDDEEAASADFRAVEVAELGDYFAFRFQRTPALDDADVAGTVRYRVRSDLAGRLFEEIVVDIGFADPPVPNPDELIGPDLLAFAELPPVRVPLLPLPRHVAEKVHAYSRTYGPQATASTRVKDLVDLALLASASAFTVGDLRSSLAATFSARATHPVPKSFPAPPPAWRVPYASLTRGLAISSDLAEGYRAVAAFLDPVLGGQLAAEGARWDPATRAWGLTPS